MLMIASVLGLVAVCVAFFAVRYVVRLVRVQPAGARCGSCQYELVAIPGGLSKCPECGSDLLKAGITTATTRGELPPTEAGVAATLAVAVAAIGVLAYLLLLLVWPFQKVATSGSSVYQPVGHADSSLPAHNARIDFDLTSIVGRPAHHGRLTLTIQRDDGTPKFVEFDASTGLVVNANFAGPSRVGSSTWPTMGRDLYLEAGLDTSKDPNFASAADAVQAELLAYWQNPEGIGNRNPHLAAVPNGGLARQGGQIRSSAIGAVIPVGASAVPLLVAWVLVVGAAYAILLRVAIRARRRALMHAS